MLEVDGQFLREFLQTTQFLFNQFDANHNMAQKFTGIRIFKGPPVTQFNDLADIMKQGTNHQQVAIDIGVTPADITRQGSDG